MDEGDVALFPAARHTVRNHDVEHPFRQDSDFWYLTGYPEAEALLLLSKGLEGVPEERLFVLPRDAEKETWTGRRCGPEGAMAQFSFEAAEELDQAEEALNETVQQAFRLWYRLGEYPAWDDKVTAALRSSRRMARRGILPPAALLDPTLVLHEMRLLKDADELERMREAAAISAEAHTLAMGLSRDGLHEYTIDAAIEYTFRRRGADAWAYPSIVAAGDNANILHYTENRARLRDGDLVLIDAGCECSLYASDITRTFPVSGRFTPAQKAIYEVVLASQKAAFEQVVAGKRFDGIHQATVRSLVEGMVDLGLLSGSVDENIETEAYQRYYMHNTSHWIGLDVHDCGAYQVGEEWRELRPGMVMTIEPGLYISASDEKAPEEFRGIGIRIEDNLLVTADGYENLTAAAPKQVADVEAACQAEIELPPALAGAGGIA